MSLRLPLHFWTTLVAALLACWCLTGPVAKVDHTVHRYMFVVDISESMGVEDVELDGLITTRIDLVKSQLRKVIGRLHCDSEIAFAIFTEHRSFLLLTPVKICENFTELDDILDYMNWQMAWRSQSEVAKGIHSAIEISEEIDPRPTTIFFTDGHESPPVHPDLRFKIKSNKAENWGLIVGVGGDKLRPIPRYDTNGKKDGYWHKEDVEQYDRFTKAIQEGRSMTGVNENPNYTGKEHMSSLKEDYLKTMASEAVFDYVRLKDNNRLADMLTDGDLGTTKNSEQDIRPHLLTLALLLFILGYLYKLIPFIKDKGFLTKRDQTVNGI